MSALYLRVLVLILLLVAAHRSVEAATLSDEGIFEATFRSEKQYSDPFNEVTVDVVFSHGSHSWRVPTFWSGGQTWTVRFAPPTPGDYSYHIESTDTTNAQLNGYSGSVRLNAYNGDIAVIKQGSPRVSNNGRYFEHADGTPFLWLGDTWWTGLSDRLDWEGFKKLTADRKHKGFTVVQLVAGLVPSEEVAPTDPGFCNEGGCVWNQGFTKINPRYFDYADRRILHLLRSGIVPAIVGAWGPTLSQLGVFKMKQHWRYIVARYGAYPVFWIAGGEVRERADSRDWTEVVQFIRAIDPFHHPLSVHESPPPADTAIADEHLTDFDLFQPSHFGWPSIAAEIAQLNTHYSRERLTKPLVVGEIGYENFAGTHTADFQRAAFWLAMLNGAAGFSYGTIAVAEAYATDKPLHRIRWALDTWDEAMGYPGSRQVGIGAAFLKNLEWWQFAPRPEWVTPRGTTLLEPQERISGFDINLMSAFFSDDPPPDEGLPKGVWSERKGNFHLPYAAGVRKGTRLFYLPYFSFNFGIGTKAPLPTVLGLETRQRYHAFYFDPASGTKFDLGTVQRPDPGRVLLEHNFASLLKAPFRRQDGNLLIADGIHKRDIVVAVQLRADSDVSLILRYENADNYLVAKYSRSESAIYLIPRKNGVTGAPLGWTGAPGLDFSINISAEVRSGNAVVSVSDDKVSYTSAIVDVKNISAGAAGLLSNAVNTNVAYDRFEIRDSPRLVDDGCRETQLVDAQGRYRGSWTGPGREDWAEAFGYESMDDYSKDKHILLDAYRPARLPFPQDWVLALVPQK